MSDLSIELVRQGHEVTMLVASYLITAPWEIELSHGVRVVRLRTPQTTDLGYIRRTLGEFLMPLCMLLRLRMSPLRDEKWDGVVWYSPTIFLGLVAGAIKSASNCRAYLIIRDIFPEWAADMGLMGRGLPFRVFKAIANYQYSVADVIGIQTSGNFTYFTDWVKRPNRRIEVLQNWLTNRPASDCVISVDRSPLAGRMIFVYAGNMGVAQGMDILLDLAERLVQRQDVGFLFVGRGSDVQRLRVDVKQRGLDNVLFFDEIDPDEIPGLYLQCHVGLVALDPRHKSHNIPGKFLSYMQAGLPVLARVNAGNDLVDLIATEKVGRACTATSVDAMAENALALIDAIGQDAGYRDRCHSLAARLYTPETAAKQIVAALRPLS